MPLEACFTVDEAFFMESIRRNRRQWGGRSWFVGLKIAAASCFVFFASVLLFSKALIAGFILLIPPFVLLFVGRFDDPATRRRFRKSPFYNVRVRYRFGEESIEVSQPAMETRMAWSVFTRAVIFDDGLLAYQGEGVFYWIPASAFATADDYQAAEQRFRAKIPAIKDLKSRR